MLIEINNKYRITSDPSNFIIEEKRIAGSTGKKVKNPGEEVWKQISFHPNLEAAVKWLIQREIRLSDALGIYAMMDCIKECEKSVTQALSELQHIS